MNLKLKNINNECFVVGEDNYFHSFTSINNYLLQRTDLSNNAKKCAIKNLMKFYKWFRQQDLSSDEN